jgi:hypothetical protein
MADGQSWIGFEIAVQAGHNRLIFFFRLWPSAFNLAAMNRCMRFTGIEMALLVLTLLSTGCVTRALWADKSFHASDYPELRLSLSPHADDILVQYLEQSAESDKTQRRAYWLFAHAVQRQEKAKPKFVTPDASLELIPIPMLGDPAATNSLPAGYCALPLAYDQGFYLWKHGRQIGRFDLPIYFVKPRSRVGRMVLTPLAVTADAVIVGAAGAVVVAVIVGLGYLEGAPSSNSL